jgi:hypothetical protein
MPDFHVAFRDLLHAVNLRHGTEGFTPPPSEGRRAEDFFALKNPTASARFEPATLGSKGQHTRSHLPFTFSGISAENTTAELRGYFKASLLLHLSFTCSRIYNY